jgi:hypothetical protein
MTSNSPLPDHSSHHQVRHDYHPHASAKPTASSRGLTEASTSPDCMDPAFVLPFNRTYPTQVKISAKDCQLYSRTAIPAVAIKSTRQEASIVANMPWMNAPDRNLNSGNEPSYIPITRPWGKHLRGRPSTNTASVENAQSPLAVWQDQAPSEEPFNNIGEVEVL